MNSTASLVDHTDDESNPSQEPRADDLFAPQEQREYARPKRKPVPAHHQYELLQPSSTATIEQKNTQVQVANEQTISHILTKRSGGWLWEAISFALAVACFAAVFGMLLALDDNQVPAWPSGISVNAILSLIVTVMKGAMGICVAECLSQIKWSWFKRDRKLIDLVIIDEATRGVWGAGRLLFTLRAWYLAYAGSFVFLAAFIIGPTVQQMVEIRIRQIELPSNATVPICNNSYYEVIGLGSGSGQNRVNLPMIGAMYDGFLQTSSQSPLRPNCPSGNCTYPRYQSLGICHQCTDFSDQLVYLNPDTNATIPTSVNSTCSQHVDMCEIQWPRAGLSLPDNDGIINSTIGRSTKIDPSLKSSDKATISIFRAVMSRTWQNHHPGTSPVAVQCLVRFCIKTYEAVINAGDFQENVVATSWKDSYLNTADSFTFQNYLSIPAKPCYVNGTERLEPWNDEDRAHCVFNVTGQSGISLYNTLDGLTTGDGSGPVPNRPFLSSDVMQALYGFFDLDSLQSPDAGTFGSVDRAFKSLSDVTTDQARGSIANCGGAVAYGIQFNDELYIHVRWIWLTPTTVVLAFCLVFFLATIVQSGRDDLWKSSPLAYLFYRPTVNNAEFTPEDMIRAARLEPRSKLSKIEKASENINVRFERRMGS